MMTADEMRDYRDKKLESLFKDGKYKNLLDYIEQKMISSIDEDPNIDMFIFYLPDDISPSLILYMLDEYGYETDYNDSENYIKIYIR